METRTIIKNIVICFIISLLLECSLFNFRVYTTHNYKSKDLTDNIVLHNLEEKNGVITINNFDDNYIEIKNIDSKINNIKLNFSNISSSYLVYKIYAQDEGNEDYFELNSERYLYQNNEKSKYVTMNLSGKSKKIKIAFKDLKSIYKDSNRSISFKLNSISINEKVPFAFSKIRFILVFSLLCLIYFFRPKSEFYKEKIDFKNKRQIGITIFSILVIALSYFYVVNINEKLIKDSPLMDNYNQYYKLTESLAHGKLYLEEEPSKLLTSMKNPYDSKAREKIMNEKGSFYRWDNAYYKGKYYVYFGVVPVVMTLLPYYLITGSHLQIYILTYIITVITVMGIFLLLKEITKRYFKGIPFMVYLILSIFMSASLIGVVEYPTVYNIPVLFSLMFVFYGLYFMISSIEKDKINTLKIFLGSLFLALVAGCRPQLLVSSFLLVPIFWDSVFKERTLFSKKSIKQTIALLFPYVVVAILLMSYNYLRFGSVVDFGANYNLTGNDMTRRGFHFDRIGYGIFVLLFQGPVLNAVFPFLGSTLLGNNYMGITVEEVSFGGLFATNLLLVLGLFFYKFKKYLPKVLYNFSFLSIIFGFIILILDIEMAGVLPRYALDFSWLFYLPTIFVVMGLLSSKLDKNIKRVILTFVVILIFLNLLYQFFTIFDDKFLHDMMFVNVDFYFKWYYLLQWWL